MMDDESGFDRHLESMRKVAETKRRLEELLAFEDSWSRETFVNVAGDAIHRGYQAGERADYVTLYEMYFLAKRLLERAER